MRQVIELAEAGSEIVRITVNTDEAARAVPAIRERLWLAGCNVPLVGDFHYHGHLFLTRHPDCAQALAKLRINPGNVGFGAKRDRQFETMIEVALQHDKPVRIGVNWGSLDQALAARLMDDNARLAAPKAADDVLREALVVSALASAARPRDRPRGRPHRDLGQGQPRAGPDRGLPRARQALALRAASGSHRGGPRRQGHRRHHGGARRAAAGGHRRHDPRLARRRGRARRAPRR